MDHLIYCNFKHKKRNYCKIPFIILKPAHNEDCNVIFCKPSPQVHNLIYNDTQWSNISIISTTNISNYIHHSLAPQSHYSYLNQHVLCFVVSQTRTSSQDLIWLQLTDCKKKKKKLVHWSQHHQHLFGCFQQNIKWIAGHHLFSLMFHSTIGFMRTFGVHVHDSDD